LSHSFVIEEVSKASEKDELLRVFASTERIKRNRQIFEF